MRKKFTYFIVGFVVGLIGMYVHVCDHDRLEQNQASFDNSKYGNWLAAQHAIFRDDFGNARLFLDHLKGVKFENVKNTRNLVVFLDSGEILGSVNLDGNDGVSRVMKAADLAKNGSWKELYSIFKSEKNQRLIPFRIWSGVGAGEMTKTLGYVEDLPSVSNSWKNFVRGSIYAATNNPKTALKYFDKVSPTFLNLGDYHLLMSFYKKYGFEKDAKSLKESWISSPGGMYMAGLNLGEDWGKYDTIQKMLAVSLIQNVSHGGENGISDSGLVTLRIASLLGGSEDSVNYYMGGYFYSAGSPSFKKYWDKLKNSSIYAPFVAMKIADIGPDNLHKRLEMDRILKQNPTFMPAIIKAWKISVRDGRESEGLRILNRALRQKKLPDAGRAYLLKMRGHTFYIFGEYEAAEQDLTAASDLLPMDADIMGRLAEVWSAEGKNLDEAYKYAISLVRAFPTNVENWNTLAVVIKAREGVEPALDILEKIGKVASECSELFQNLGDLRMKTGDKIGAADAYQKAIALSDDGLVIRSDLERKLDKINIKRNKL